MAVRVPVKVRVGERLLRTVALATPVTGLRRLSCLFLSRLLGGSGSAEVAVDVADAEPPRATANVVVSPLADEVLPSDALINELGIVIEDAKKGLWRFRWEPPPRLRASAPPEYWR